VKSGGGAWSLDGHQPWGGAKLTREAKRVAGLKKEEREEVKGRVKVLVVVVLVLVLVLVNVM